jgi:ribonuclease P protein component
MRFRPEQHLRRQSDFRVIRERGRRLTCGPFTLWCLRREPAAGTTGDAAASVDPTTAAEAPAPAGALCRVGVVASSAAVGNAVKRARAKRRLREVFRRHQEQVPAGCDLLLTARTSINRSSYSEIERHFLEGCRQISVRAHA